MPMYQFRNKETGEIIERTMKISDLDQWKEDNPEYETYIAGAPTIGDSVRLGRQKPDQGFREVLSKIKQAHPRGTIDTG